MPHPGSPRRATMAPKYRRARACPSPCLGYKNDRGGQAPALRAQMRFFPPGLGHANDRGGQAPALRLVRPPPFTVGEGLSLAMQRSRVKPARMRVWHPRAPALRLVRPRPFTVGEGLSLAVQRSRGTGPRATGQDGVLLAVGRWETLSLAMQPLSSEDICKQTVSRVE